MSEDLFPTDERPKLTLPSDQIERAIARQALDAQVRLLPYALGFFGICLPVFVMLGVRTPNATWLAVCLGAYGFVWALFYLVLDWLRRTPGALENVELRTRIQLAGGLLWAVALFQTSFFAAGAGWLSETMLVLCAGAAAGVIFFASPTLPGLLVIAPVAAAGPIIVLKSNPQTDYVGNLVESGLALCMALSLVLNRHLREHFLLNLERQGLIEDRDGALKEARRLAKSKSDIVATLSHEIRNGLSGVAHVLAGALGAGSRGAPSREQLKAALHAAHDLVDVLDATLDSETAEAGTLSVATRPIDAPRLVEELVLLNRPNAAAKNVEISAQVDDVLAASCGAAIGDSARVRQVLNNLIGNAVKYTMRGRIEVRAHLIANTRVRLEVVDSGPGLSAEELRRAFEPFARIERTGAGIPGAGLGLSLSRQLARLMNGEVGAESAPGVGSRFWLDLPYDAKASVEDVVSAGPDAQSRPMRVLVVEDDGLNAAMLRAVLEQLGHRVLHAQDGRRAIDLLRVSEFDLVMLDGRMPGMDGPETAREIRGLTGSPADLPIVAVIGGDAEEAQSMTEAGADTVLRKPVTVASVARAVADAGAIKANGRRRASAAAA
ncbi:MAG TPA: ATP-binding protein [Caulobacteraceae bacterium]|jgi:signal transduction histidine kinase/ActR/RegA family two-component response regulator